MRLKHTKTFDIALRHLKDIDFSHKDIFENPILVERYEKFVKDKDNNQSNDHYKGVVFFVCVYHLHDLACNTVSKFYVALEIIESLKDTELHQKYMNTKYPKIMVDEWNNYCNSLISAPPYMSTDNEIRFHIFTTAYHYVYDQN